MTDQTQTNQPTPNQPTEPVSEEQVLQIMAALRPNWPRRIIIGVLTTAACAVGGFFGSGALFGIGWWRWLVGAGAAALGLGMEETYQWFANQADNRRFIDLIAEVAEVYQLRGEKAAEMKLRDSLSVFRTEQQRERKAFEAAIGDLDAVAEQAAEAKADAQFARKVVDSATEKLEVLVTRIESINDGVAVEKVKTPKAKPATKRGRRAASK